MSLEGSCILSQQIIVDYGKKKERKKMYLRRPPGFHKNSTFNQKTLASNAWFLYLNKNKKPMMTFLGHPGMSQNLVPVC